MASGESLVRRKHAAVIEGEGFSRGISARKGSPNGLMVLISPRLLAPAGFGNSGQALNSMHMKYLYIFIIISPSLNLASVAEINEDRCELLPICPFFHQITCTAFI